MTRLRPYRLLLPRLLAMGLGVAVWAAPSSTQAQIVDEFSPFVAPLPSVGEDGQYDYFAQSFIAEVGKVTIVGAWLRADSGGGEVQFAILGNGANNLPDPSVVSYQGPLRSPSTAGGWVYDTISGAALSPGQIYWFAIDGYQTVLGTGYSSVGISTTFPTTNGSLQGSTDGGQSWQLAIGNPMAFYIEGDTCSRTVSISSDNPVICPGQTVQLSATIGFSSYLWSTGATSSTISVTDGGAYAVTVTDANLCLGTTNYFIQEALPFTSLLDDSYTGCQGGTVDVAVSNLWSDILWSNGATTSSTQYDSAGTFTVQVTDPLGCNRLDTFSIVLNPAPSVYLGPDTTLCEGEFLQLDAGPGMAGYDWSNGSSNRSITVNTTGTYSVLITGQNGCSSQSNPVLVTFEPSPATPELSLTLTGITSTFAFAYTWLLDGDTLPIATQTILDPGPGVYQVLVENGFGCTAISDTLSIAPESPGSFISEGFSPNGDGLNEVFFVEGVEAYPDARLVVMNRWGDEVHRAQPYRNGWRGTGPGGKPLPDGNYYYVLDLGPGLPTRKGAVLINR